MTKKCVEPAELKEDQYKGAVGPMTGWGREKFNQWHQNWDDAIKMMSRPDSTRPVNAMQRFGQLAFLSNDGALASLAKRYGKDGKPNETIQQIREMFYGRAGGLDKATSQTYEEATRMKTSQFMAGLHDVLEPISRNADAMKEVTKKVQNPTTIRMAGDAIDRAAGAIRKQLDEALKYANKAGLEVGYQDGYFPRVLDRYTIQQDPEGFKQVAIKAYQASGVTDAAEAEQLAEAWTRTVLYGDVMKPGYQDFFNFGNGLPTKDFSKGRTLSKEADDILQKYLVTDPQDVLGSYFQRLTQRAEFERRFGREPGSAPDSKSKWDMMKEKMLKDGAAEAIPDVIEHIQSMTGESPAHIGIRGRKALGWVQTWNMLALLPRATLTSLNELMMFGVRGDGITSTLQGVAATIGDLVRADPTTGMRDVAEFLGIVNQASHDGALAARLGGGLETRGQRWLTDQFFRRTGLHRYTDATRVAATGVGQSFVRRVALDVAEGNSRQKASSIMLNELGIPEAKHKEFAEWVKRFDDQKPTVSDIKNSEMGDMYGKALIRFADQTVMIPKASEKPFYASHPIGKLSYGLLSYMFSFQKNVLNRAGEMAWKATTQKDLTLADRWALMGPARNLPMMIAGAYGLNEARNELYGSKSSQEKFDKMSGSEKFFLALSRSGLTGVADYPLNVLTGIKYQRDPATIAVGPALANGFTTLADAAKLGMAIKGRYDIKENGNPSVSDGQLNSAKRSLAKDVYSFGIIPMANAVAAWQPVPSVGAVAIQAISSDRAKMAFVDALAPREEDLPASRKSMTRAVRRQRVARRVKRERATR